MSSHLFLAVLLLIHLAGCRTKPGQNQTDRAGRDSALVMAVPTPKLIDDSTGSDSAAVSPLTLYIQRNLCPFEYGCNFAFWIFEDTLAVYAAEGDTTSIAFHVFPGDTILPSAMDMYVEHPGVLAITKPILQFVRGDTLYVLSYTGEGYYDVWFNGRIENVATFWDWIPPTNNSGLLLSQPRMSWWVKIATATGRSGWLRLVNTAENGISFSENIEMRRHL